MVKKLLKFFGFTLFFVLALVAFMPKESLYFLLEKNLKKFDVVISNERVDDKMLSLNVQNLEISTKEIDSATVSDAEITLLFLYNKLTLSDIELSSLVDAYVPSKVNALDVTYSVLNPLVVQSRAEGQFGEAKLEFHLVDRELKVVLQPSKVMLSKYKKSINMMTKDENGEYVYAKTF